MNKKLYYGLMAFFAIIVVGCAVYLGIYYLSSFMADKNQQELAEYIDESVDAGDEESDTSDAQAVQKKYKKLYEMNQDFIGWLTIPDTKIDYAVMMNTDENEFYLRRDFNKDYSKAGMLFADNKSDISTPGTNILIYGHNMKAGTMFHDLFKYADEEFYQTHMYITFDTIYRNGTYEIIAAFYTQIETSDSDSYRYYQFFEAESEEEFDTYVDYVRSKTAYDTAGAVFGDELITLSTCSYHTDNGRFVVVAKRITPESETDVNNDE